MIRIIEPKEYKPVSVKENKQNPKPTSLFSEHQSESEKQSDDDMEVQIVNTEEKANQVVYKYCNVALFLLFSSILAAFFIHSRQRLTITVNDIQYVDVPTIYSAKVQQRQEQISILVPDQKIYEDKRTQIAAKMCVLHQIKDCWRQVLLTRGFMFLEVEKWIIEHEVNSIGNILVFWEERMALSVLLMSLNIQRHRKVEVIVKQEHPKIYIQSLKLSLKKYQVDDKVKFIEHHDYNVEFFRNYGLIIGNHQIFDQQIYPELLEQAVNQGTDQLVSSILYNFLLKTKLIIFYQDGIKESTIEYLEYIHNQVTSIQVDQQTNQIHEKALKYFWERFFVIVLDERMKDPSEFKIKKKQVFQQPFEEPDLQEEATIFSEKTSPIIVQVMAPLKVIHRLSPSRIIGFFYCRPSGRDDVQVGQIYESAFNNIKLRKSHGVSSQSQTFLYNFVLHYLLASESCNILNFLPDEMLANVAALTNKGQLFIPSLQNTNTFGINQSLTINHHNFILVDEVIAQRKMKDFIYKNEIGLIFITWNDFVAFFYELKISLKMNINIIMKLESNQNQRQLFLQLLKEFYIFVIIADPQKKYSTSCIDNFDVLYYSDQIFPQNSYILISKTNILFEEIDPINYYVRDYDRSFQNKRYPCLRNFATIESKQKYNLKKGSKILSIDDLISIQLTFDVQLQQAISQIKFQEGFSHFYWNGLFVSDKVVIIGQAIKSSFLLASLMRKIGEDGSLFFINSKESRRVQIQKLLKINTFQTKYQFLQMNLTDSEQLEIFLHQYQASVMFLSPQMFGTLQKVIKSISGLMVLLQSSQQNKKLLLDSDIFDKTKKLFQITSLASKPNPYNLCLNYKMQEINQQSGFTYSDLAWNVFLI